MSHASIYALGVAGSPIAIGAILIILSSRGVSANAVSFAAGWIVGVAISAIAFTVLVHSLGITDSAPAWIAAADLILGLGFLVVAIRLWLRWKPGRLHPSWLDQVDRVTPGRSTTLGIIFSCANPKVLALSLGAALSIAQAGADPLLTVSTVAVFVAIGAAGVLIPIVAYLALPTQGAAMLARLRCWLGKYERVVFAGLAVAIGAFFTQDGIASLMS